MSTPDSTPITQINMANIRVAGIGGLGMVAMAVVVAIYLPGIRLYAFGGLAGGVLAGAGYIWYRRRHAPLNWDEHYADRPESNFHHL